MLSGLALMRQASFFERMFFYFPPSLDDGVVTAEVNVGRRQVAETFVIAVVIVALNEGADADLKVARQIVILEQDAVLQGLMPPFDLALGLGMHWRAANVLHAFFLEVFGQIFGDVG